MKHRSFAFLIGINEYPNIGNLISPVRDVNALSKVLKEEQGFDHVGKILNAEATSIRQLLRWLETGASEDLPENLVWLEEAVRLEEEGHTPMLAPDKIEKEDYVVFYFAGHGVSRELSDQADRPPVGFLMPSDASMDSQLIEMKEVFEAFDQTGCKQLLLILDCCFAGSIRFISTTRSAAFGGRPFYEDRFESFLEKKSRQVLVSSGPGQKAADLITMLGDRNQMHLEGHGHSPFAFALIEALKGKAELSTTANKQDGIITPQELIIYLKKQVHHLTTLILEQAPEYFPIGGHEGGDFVFLDPNNPSNFSEWNAQNPYKGLSPFEPEDRLFFFGREKEIHKLLDKLFRLQESNQQALLFVTAPSGQGKSSLIKAGLFPQLKAQKEEDGKQLFLFYGRPSRAIHWMEHHSEANEEGKYYRAIDLDRRIADLSETEEALLLVDQFEEALTNFTKETLNTFCLNILRWLENDRLTFVITLRSDSEWRLKESLLLPHWKHDHIHRLPAMSLNQLRESIKQPAALNWFDFDPHLVDMILADIEGTPGALPLLSVLMESLYREEESNANRRLKVETYQNKLKGIHGALSSKANKVLQHLEAEDNGNALVDTFRKVFLRMVRLEDAGLAGRRVFYRVQTFADADTSSSENQQPLLHELDYPDDHQDQLIHKVIKELEANHLIVHDADSLKRPFIEPIHDALVQHWDTGKKWIDGFGKQNLLLQRALWDVVNAYQTELRQKSSISSEQLLWDDHSMIDQLKADLDQKGNWFNQAESDFIQKSWEKKQDIIERLKKERDSAQALAMTAEARRVVITDPTIGLSLAMEAYQTFPNKAAVAVVNDITSNTKNYFYKVYNTQKDITCLAISKGSENEDQFLFCGLKKGLEVWDLSKDQLFQKYSHHEGSTTAIGLSSTKMVAIGTVAEQTFLTLYQLDQEEPIFSLPSPHRGRITKIIFSAHKEYLISGGADGSVAIWDFEGEVKHIAQTVEPNDIDPAKLQEKNLTDIVEISDGGGRIIVLTRDEKYFMGHFIQDNVAIDLLHPLSFNRRFEHNNGGVMRSKILEDYAFFPTRKYYFVSSNFDSLSFWNPGGFNPNPQIQNAISLDSIIPDFVATTTLDYLKRHPHISKSQFSPRMISNAMTFSEDGHFICLSFDKHLLVLNEDGSLLQRVTFEEPIMALSYYGPKQSLIVATNKIQIFQLVQQPIFNFSFALDEGINLEDHFEIRFSPAWGLGSNVLAIQAPDGEIQIFNKDTQKIVSIQPESDLAGKECQISFSPSGHFLLVHYEEKGAVYHLDGRPIFSFEGQAIFEEDGQYLGVEQEKVHELKPLPIDEASTESFPFQIIRPLKSKYKIVMDDDPSRKLLYLCDSQDHRLYTYDYRDDATSLMAFLSPDSSNLLFFSRQKENNYAGVLINHPIGLLESGQIYQTTFEEYKEKEWTKLVQSFRM